MRRLRVFQISIPTFCLIALSPGVGGAQTLTPGEQELRQRVLRLEQRVEQLEAERRPELGAAKPVAKPGGSRPEECCPYRQDTRIDKIEEELKEVDRRIAAQHPNGNTIELPQVNAGPKGFTIQSGDGAFNLKVRGYVQADSHWYTTGSKPASGSAFLLKRVRPVFEGTVFKYFDYKMMPDFGQGAALVQDAYLDAHYYQPTSIMVGKFKGPLDFERLVSARDLDFVERALTINLVPNRVMGFQLHGNLLNSRLEYSLGLVNGIPDQNASTDIASNDGKEFMGRAFVWPFKTIGAELLRGFGFGVGGSVGDQRGALPKYLTTGQNTFFAYESGITAAGQRYRLEPQIYYHYGPVGLLGEFVQNTEGVTSAQTIKGGIAKAPVSDSISNQAWQIQGSYLLTGEESTYLGVRPRRRFDPPTGGWGALELVARASDLQVDRNAFSLSFADPAVSSREAHEWAIGLNWYLNQNVKLMCDYARTSFTWGSRLPGRNRRDESTVLTRAQVAF
jgi:phosphate-selective porin OprO and OprP